MFHIFAHRLRYVFTQRGRSRSHVGLPTSYNTLIVYTGLRC